MHKVISRAGLLILLFLLSLALFAQEAIKNPMPENFKNSLSQKQKSKGEFNIPFKITG